MCFFFSSDVAFTQYSYKSLADAFIEIPCIARSSSQVLQELEIIRDGIPIASMNRSVNDSRYSVRSEAYDGDVRLILSISSVKCQDQGTYTCKMYKKDDTNLTSPNMFFSVEGNISSKLIITNSHRLCFFLIPCSRIIHSQCDVTIAGEGMPNVSYTRLVTRDGSLLCNTPVVVFI